MKQRLLAQLTGKGYHTETYFVTKNYNSIHSSKGLWVRWPVTTLWGQSRAACFDNYLSLSQIQMSDRYIGNHENYLLFYKSYVSPPPNFIFGEKLQEY